MARASLEVLAQRIKAIRFGRNAIDDRMRAAGFTYEQAQVLIDLAHNYAQEAVYTAQYNENLTEPPPPPSPRE